MTEVIVDLDTESAEAEEKSRAPIASERVGGRIVYLGRYPSKRRVSLRHQRLVFRFGSHRE